MALPIAIAGLGASLVGGAASAVGAATSATAQAGMYNYQAGIAKQNEQFALNAGEGQASQQGMKARAQIGQTKAAQGASGFLLGSGTNADVVSSERSIANLEQTTTRSNANQAAYGYAAQSELDVAAAKNAQTAGDIGIASSVLGTAGSVSSKWLQGQQQGLFSSSNVFGL
jgi:hypothetical protein